ncbi:hypothetical protein FPV67DRAFT_1455169 [Lyophyllum atratum]|nr:hypothetical protein FPV67DRAFT_1455169 [Lyophyllum atratum]
MCSILLLAIVRASLAATTFDYVIVGGGATGLALAVRLSEDPSKSVAVLEAGGTGFGKLQSPNITDLRLSRNNLGTVEDWQFVTVPQATAGGRVQAQVQGRVLGGGSAINSGMYLRGNKIEYDALEILGAKGWNWETMFAAVKKAGLFQSEHFFPPTPPNVRALNLTFNPKFHGNSGPVALSLQALNISRLFPDVVVPTLRALGFEMNFDSNGGRHNGPSWNYLDLSDDYLPAANRTNLHVMTNSHVSKIIWSKNKTKDGLLKATGVEYIPLDDPRGPRLMTLNANNVILSASAMNTPKILELSGESEQIFAINVAPGEKGTANLVFDRIVLLRPLSRGFVHINSTDPLIPPLIDPKYLSAPHDKFVLAKAVEYTRTLVNTEPLKSLIEGPILPDSTVQTEDDFLEFINTQSQSEHHFVGTAAMTPRSQGGVVDPSLVVYGTSNVRVADVSIIANLPGIHTVSLAYMIAERAAEIIQAGTHG